MHTWEDKPYWVIADNIAYTAYRQLFSQIEKRGTNCLYFSLPTDLSNYKLFVCDDTVYFENLDYDHNNKELCIEDQVYIDYKHKIVTDSSMSLPDNIATCAAIDDYCEIDIVTLLPKNYRIKALLKNEKFKWDFLNVIRHEIEHMFQGCNFKTNVDKLKEYDRSENNFLLKACEVPAYVHGFRIVTKSRKHFLDTVTEFIKTHGRHIKLKKNEIENTIKIWCEYLKNLNYHCKIY